MTVGLIWAQTNSGVIGRKGAIPWHLPEDMAHFKELTMGHTVVMGRRTWESLPAKVRPLPGRRNIVITRQADYVADGAEVMTSLDDALTADDYVWVIGGAEIYPLALPRASVCEVTEIALDEPPEDDDAFAPLLDKSWVADPPAWRSSRVGLRYRFSTYRRR